MIELAEAAKNLFGIGLTSAQITALERYEQELLEWNSRFNLTAIESPDQVRLKHFLDSFSCMLALRGTPMKSVIDVGSGAGFPGLPLKIINQQMRLTLVESVGKKASFCQHIIQTLKLEDVYVLQERAEAVGQKAEHRERYDWALARAVASTPESRFKRLCRIMGSLCFMNSAISSDLTRTLVPTCSRLGRPGRLTTKGGLRSIYWGGLCSASAV
jgi:16S rRNA (guanine527-N7)-methyltransferase